MVRPPDITDSRAKSKLSPFDSNEQVASVNRSAEDEIRVGIETPSVVLRVVEKERVIRENVRYPVFVTPAIPSPPRLLVKENVALLIVWLDWTVVLVKMSLFDISPDVRMSITLPLPPVK
jgi:hypothetical protein